MVQSRAQTVTQYLAELPPDRRNAIAAVRKVVLDNLPVGYEESMQYGMIGYVVPLERYPETYNGNPLMIAALGSQKNYMAIYLMCACGHKQTQQSFVKEWKASGKKLDMGKSCVRFKKLDDLVLPLIGKVIARVSVDQYLAIYEKSRQKRR